MDYLWRHQLPATLLDIGHWDSTRILTIGSSSSEKKVVMASLASSILSLGKAWFRDALRILGTFSLDLDNSSLSGIFWDWIIHSHIHRIFMIGHFLRLSDAKYHPHHSNSLLSKAVRYLASSSIFPTKLSLSYKIVSPLYENVFPKESVLGRDWTLATERGTLITQETVETVAFRPLHQQGQELRLPVSLLP